MKISIIVPVYNIKDYIENCIKSIIAQSYRNVEIILVDDGSTDGSQNICDDYKAKDNRIKVIHKENGGLVSARQAGVVIATGDYITNVDGDDWIEENCISEYVNAIDKSNADIIWNISLYRDYHDKSILQEYRVDDLKSIINEAVQRRLLDLSMGINGFEDDLSYYVWNKCIKKEIYTKAVTSIDKRIRMAEDAACVFRCLALTNSVYFISKPLNHYVQRETSISHDFKHDDLHAIQLMRDETVVFIKDKAFYNDCMIGEINQIYINVMMIKSVEVLQDTELDYLVPFKNVKKGNRVVVYGIGNVGKKIIDYIIKCTLLYRIQAA